MRREYVCRLAALQEGIRARGWLGAMLLKPENQRYLTGFVCAVNNVERLMALLVPAKGEPVFVVPRLEVTLAKATGVERTIGFYYTEPFEKLRDGFATLGWVDGRVGVEMSFLTVDKFRAIRDIAPGIELADCAPLMASLRLTKSDLEIRWLEIAARATDQAAAAVREFIRPGVTEAELAGFLVREITAAGAQAPAFFPTVQAGAGATLPNSVPTSRRLELGEVVVVDFGAEYEGLRTDVCRSFAVGGPGTVSHEAREIHRVVLEAQQAAIGAVAPGRPAADPHRAALAVIENAGYAAHFTHAVGHGVGYEVHEPPSLAAHNEEPLRPGMVVSIEPGIYVDGIGIRIEDVVLVTADGCRVLTTADREL